MDIYIKLKYGVSTLPEAYWYCLANGRTPELEELILTSPEYAYRYARDIINGRWKEGEKIILADPKFSYHYAIGVIRGKWEDGEEVILNSCYADRYEEWICILS